MYFPEKKLTTVVIRGGMEQECKMEKFAKVHRVNFLKYSMQQYFNSWSQLY